MLVEYRTKSGKLVRYKRPGRRTTKGYKCAKPKRRKTTARKRVTYVNKYGTRVSYPKPTAKKRTATAKKAKKAKKRTAKQHSLRYTSGPMKNMFRPKGSSPKSTSRRKTTKGYKCAKPRSRKRSRR